MRPALSVGVFVSALAARVASAEAIPGADGWRCDACDPGNGSAVATALDAASRTVEIGSIEEQKWALITPGVRSQVEIGGAYRFSLIGIGEWPLLGEPLRAPLIPASQDIVVDLATTAFIDARPRDEFRMFGKVDVSYPFVANRGAFPPRRFDDILRVREMFSDFIIGRQTLPAWREAHHCLGSWIFLQSR